MRIIGREKCSTDGDSSRELRNTAFVDHYVRVTALRRTDVLSVLWCNTSSW